MSDKPGGSGSAPRDNGKSKDESRDGSSAETGSDFPVQVKLEVTEEASEPLQERGTPFFNFSDVSMVSGFMQSYPGLSDYVLTNAQYHATPHHGPGRKKKPPNIPLPVLPGSYRTGAKHRKEFPCERCNEVFEKREELRVHVMMHAGEKPFECRVCKKSFAKKANLIEHEISHSGVRPYICNLCAKSFSSCTDLMNHRLLHSGLKPHVCNMCGQGFTEMGHLRSHKELMHGTPHYKCSCGMGFTHIAELIKHKKEHPQGGEFSCQYCGKTFSEQAALIVHKRVHMEDKGFVCNSCGEKFEKAGPLIQHRKKVCRDKVANAAIAQLQNAASALGPPPAALVGGSGGPGPSHGQIF
ncbi:unnamed protein product [Notodromas monacha]|uniref:C2H2-type domain-containing protein n=1 Tax=Notodromas monacha TaxID=399045 RepID=A0A7R9BID7_9CRUS|nr:unnamed protein product [Notodromas monacha]CAG0914659.1 unnamed protein product [Notodromas monacha]